MAGKKWMDDCTRPPKPGWTPAGTTVVDSSVCVLGVSDATLFSVFTRVPSRASGKSCAYACAAAARPNPAAAAAWIEARAHAGAGRGRDARGRPLLGSSRSLSSLELGLSLEPCAQDPGCLSQHATDRSVSVALVSFTSCKLLKGKTRLHAGHGN